jgi:uncharacterized membrane-anchored protein
VKLRALFAVGAALLVVTTTAANAQNSSPDNLMLKSLNFRRGHIELMGGIAALDLGQHYVYLDPKDAETFLTKVWGNPPGDFADTAGMLLPTNVAPDSPDGWGVILGYENDGHVSDSDASSTNYDDLLAQMKKDVLAHNDDRVKRGYQPIELLGWAQPPHYDSQAKTIYWAKRLRFGDDTEETLNYFIRVLGRTGVLDLNVVASINQLPLINKEAAGLMSVVSFNPGQRYAEYDAGSDHTAAYGIAGLIAGGVLVKAGFLKGLIALLAAFWKVVAVGVVGVVAAIGSFFKRIFGRLPSA